jgi:hypothetical protein
VVDASTGPLTTAPLIIDMDVPALTFRCEQSAEDIARAYRYYCMLGREHVNIIAGAVVGMIFTHRSSASHFVGLLLREVWGLSLHDAVRVGECEPFPGGQIFYFICARHRVAFSCRSTNESQQVQWFPTLLSLSPTPSIFHRLKKYEN